MSFCVGLMFGKIGDYNRNLQVDDLGKGKLFEIWDFYRGGFGA
jgi:hypothetical protein